MIHLENCLRLGRQALQPITRFQGDQILPENPLFAAVTSNNLHELTNLVEFGNPINVLNSKGDFLLNVVMRQKRVEIFNYLLSKEVDVNFLDRLQQTPLLYLVRWCFDEYFALELIKKGADIHRSDNAGCTVLYLAAKSIATLRVGQIVIERGGDINATGEFGYTPLYVACESGNFYWVCMLLYYGADITKCSARGTLPLAALSKFKSNEVSFVLGHIFDEHNATVSLPSLLSVMVRNSPLVPQILELVTDVEYNSTDLQHFVNNLPNMQSRDLKMFVDKFGEVVEEMFGNFLVLDNLVYMASCFGTQNVKDIFEIFLKSELVAEFVQTQMKENSTVALLLQNLGQNLSEEEFTEMICIMLSYGLTVTSRDLDEVYNTYGFCDLFEILLHMDVFMLSSKQPSVAPLYYNPHADIEVLDLNPQICACLLEFYNHRKLKKFGQSSNEVIEKVEKLPVVPLLVELSRNAARKFIVDKFYIQTSVHFNLVLQTLPIGEMNRAIISLRKKLY